MGTHSVCVAITFQRPLQTTYSKYEHGLNTENIVYLITKCKVKYVGQNKRKLKDRLNGHRTRIKHNKNVYYYRAMHFSAKRGIAIACRLSVRLSVCLSVTLVNCDHIG